jgi:hypothetical protein
MSCYRKSREGKLNVEEQEENHHMIIADATVPDIDGLFDVYKDYEEQEHQTANAMFAAQGLPLLSPDIINEHQVKTTFEEQINDDNIKLLVVAPR